MGLCVAGYSYTTVHVYYFIHWHILMTHFCTSFYSHAATRILLSCKL